MMPALLLSRRFLPGDTTMSPKWGRLTFSSTLTDVIEWRAPPWAFETSLEFDGIIARMNTYETPIYLSIGIHRNNLYIGSVRHRCFSVNLNSYSGTVHSWIHESKSVA